MIGMNLVTHQTGSCRQVEVTQAFTLKKGCDIKRELYLSLLMDRDFGHIVTFVASTEGGMDIEEVAEKTP